MEAKMIYPKQLKGDFKLSDYQTLELVKGNVKVEWNYIGEGFDGDYNPQNPKDMKLLRFDVYRKESEDEWEIVDDASYCTFFPVNASIDAQMKGLLLIMDNVGEKVENGDSIKKVCEQLSNLDETCKVPFLNGY